MLQIKKVIGAEYKNVLYMYRKLFYLLILWLPFTVRCAENIRVLEGKMYWHSGDRIGENKMAIAQKILKLDPVNKRAIEFVCENYQIREADSNSKADPVNVFLDGIIAKHPDNKDLYILKSKYFNSGHRQLTDKEYAINEVYYLKKAYQLDPTNAEINYLLAQAYYTDFLRPYYNLKFGIGIKPSDDEAKGPVIKKHPVLTASSVNALHYLQNVMKYGSDSLKTIAYFPIQQLRYHLYKAKPEPLCYPKRISDRSIYPPWYYANLKAGWHKNLSENYMILIEWSADRIYSMGRFYQSINELPLMHQKIKANQEIIRFSWFRSFQSTVFVRLDKTGNTIILSWKEISWSDSLKKNVFRNGKRHISLPDYKSFSNWLDRSGFDRYDAYEYVPMFDGKTWVMERLRGDHFKVYHSNEPPEDFVKACYLLVSFTDIDLTHDLDRKLSMGEIKNMRTGLTPTAIMMYGGLGFGLICLVLIAIYLPFSSNWKPKILKKNKMPFCKCR